MMATDMDLMMYSRSQDIARRAGCSIEDGDTLWMDRGRALHGLEPHSHISYEYRRSGELVLKLNPLNDFGEAIPCIKKAIELISCHGNNHQQVKHAIARLDESIDWIKLAFADANACIVEQVNLDTPLEAMILRVAQLATEAGADAVSAMLCNIRELMKETAMPQVILNKKQVEELTAEVLASGGKVTQTLQECRDAYGLDSKKEDDRPTLFDSHVEADVAE